MRRYTVVLTPDPETGGYTVTVPALPGCVTAGDTVDEAIANAQDLIPLWLAELAERGEEIPEETRPSLVTVVEIAEPAAAGVRHI